MWNASRAALVQPYQSWLSEDYYIIQLNEVLDAKAAGPTRKACWNATPIIAQIVRGEVMPLSAGERREALQASLSYYPTDLLVVGWVAALILTPRKALPRPSSCSSTPTRNCSNSGTTTTC